MPSTLRLPTPTVPPPAPWGVAVVRAGIITHTRSWLIRPHTGLDSFDRYATRVHGITPEMTSDAPSLPESMGKLAALIGDGPVLAHNMG